MLSPAGSARRCAVLGSPIAHSLSPALHRAAYAALGLDWDYAAVEVQEEGLGAFLDGLEPAWRGLSLTMPLKRAVMPLLDEVSSGAGRAGAANTVVLEDGRRVGYNTDVPGAVAALRRVLGEQADGLDSAVVLGGGATATSVLLALGDLGCGRALLAVREPARAAETVQAVSRVAGAPTLQVVTLSALADLDGPDVLVSTIPAGAQDIAATELASASGAVFEVVYDPWPTPVARAALDVGVPLISGLDLLLHQAVLQVELMTGLPAPVDAMRAALPAR